MPYLGIFRLEFEKETIVIFDATNSSKCKVLCKTKKNYMSNQKIPLLGILGNNWKSLWSYSKSASSNLPKCKVSCKRKKLEI